MTDRPSAIAVVSGGLDSVVSLAVAHRELTVRLILFFDYGQRALDCERAAAMAAATFYEIPYEEVSLPWLAQLAPAGMRRDAEEPAGPGALSDLDAVWIPNRNGVFLNVAAAYAERYGCEVVVTGFNREEAAEFPDNSADYVDRANRALLLSTRNGVEVRSYTIDSTKREIIERGHAAGAPLSVIWSCYRCGERMCGECASCRRLAAALAEVPADRRPVIEFEPGE